MANHQAIFRRFAEFLDTKQAEHEINRDIRKYIISKTSKKIGFGLEKDGIRTNFGANLPKLFPKAIAVNEEGFNRSELFFTTGTIFRDEEHSHKGAIQLYNEMPEAEELIFFEPAFLATTHSWSHSFREGNPDYACLGYVYDDLAYYFMADYPNRIIQKLNSDEQPNTDELTRARGLIQRIVERRISKYNAQPMHAPAMREGYTRRVLVCDQAFADASTIYGKADEATFEKMLVAAIQENPDAEILVKTHPDSSWEKSKRSGYYSHLSSSGRVRLLREPVNPYCIFDLVDKVYVGTSQMGLEALFSGKEVVCFGAPFYAGWGLTDDRQKIPHRHRQRSLEELFHYFYIWYTIYHVPECEAPSQIEDALDYIEAHRPYTLPPTKVEAASPPRVSIIIPVYGVEDYIEECLTSIQNQSLREIEIIPVNDCSPDGSQAIIDRLAVQDPRIRPIVLSENVGQGFARNRGIEAAHGEYLWFIDADDWMPNSYFLEKAVMLADQEGSDMVRGRRLFKQIESGSSQSKTVIDNNEEYFSAGIHRTSFKDFPEILLSWNFWLWLYRRDFVEANNIKFDLAQMEERSFIIKALLSSSQISLINEDAVRYRVRQNSTMRKPKSKKNIRQMLKNFSICIDLFINAKAHEKDSPFKAHFHTVIWQFMSILFMGWPYRSISAHKDNQLKNEFLSCIKEKLIEAQFQTRNISALKDFYKDGAAKTSDTLKLAVSATVSGQYELVDVAVHRKEVDQNLYLNLLLNESPAPHQEDLKSALNEYARNERVKTAKVRMVARAQKPRIVVHIGATKTGSTYLQHFMEKNRPALLRAGVWFPEVGLFWQPTRPHKQAGHSDFIRAAVNNRLDLRNHIEAGLALMPEKIHTIILSSEAFFLNENAPLIADYFSGYPIEMVAYLRRQDEWANAQYCEFVAGGAIGRVDAPFSEWLKHPETQRRLDYRIPLTAWSDVIGKENVKVRVFEKDQLHNHDLLADFAEATRLPILLDLPEPQADDRNAARLSAAHVELIRLFNSRPFRNRNAYFDFIEEVTQKLQRWRTERGLTMPKPWILSDDEASEIMDRAKEINQEVVSTYLGRETGSLFGSAAAAPEPTGVFPEEITLIAEAYERAKPADTKPPQSKRSTAPETSPQAVSMNQAKIINYGLFGWRYWLLTPLLALLFAKRATSELQREFLKEPAQFARKNWSQRRPVMTKLLYPDTDPMGPFQVFRIWVRLMSKVARLSGRAHLSKAIEDDPIRFARTMNNPVRRFIGRLMFPCGELRQPLPIEV